MRWGTILPLVHENQSTWNKQTPGRWYWRKPCLSYMIRTFSSSSIIGYNLGDNVNAVRAASYQLHLGRIDKGSQVTSRSGCSWARIISAATLTLIHGNSGGYAAGPDGR